MQHQVNTTTYVTPLAIGIGLLFAVGAMILLAPAASAQTGCGNNCFATSSLLSVGNATVDTSTYSLEVGEPRPCGTIGKTAWYHFTVTSTPVDGVATLDTDGSSFDTVLAVYNGTSFASLTTIACVDDTPTGLQAKVTFTCVVGTTYRVQLGGFNNASGLAKLSHSGCVTSAPVPSAPNNLGATSMPDRVQVSLAWSPSADASITSYKIYRGATNGSETLYRTISPASGFTDTNLSYNTLYWYQVAAVNAVGESPRSGHVSALTACLSGSNNDCFANATSLSSPRPLTFGVSMLNKTREPGEPTTCTSGTPTAWVRFTATTDGLARVERVSGEYARVGAFTGSSLAALSQRGCATLQNGALEFECTAGTTYRLQIASGDSAPSFQIDGCGPVTQTIGTGDPLRWDIHQSSSATPCGSVRLCGDNVVIEITLRGSIDRSPDINSYAPIVTAENAAYAKTPAGSFGEQVGFLLPRPPNPGPGGVPDPDEIIEWATSIVQRG